ncbi:hypothetical protein AMJ39_09380 [candidate division TA06 bacterium DG_24]|uniref:Uncharacterized protein n=2 Tax=Bacteria division TA06 TaxID=1156500 RepID=A0A0S8JF76_UNCT6|nr:MAG: hypothetical protein AMJ39_09380 [candidate division TA06 bacterium DG_24]KPL07484.1 MAG: hypothetical protein AMJ71_08920 [candidate division TA06 bacterium SM1_40]
MRQLNVERGAFLTEVKMQLPEDPRSATSSVRRYCRRFVSFDPMRDISYAEIMLKVAPLSRRFQ